MLSLSASWSLYISSRECCYNTCLIYINKSALKSIRSHFAFWNVTARSELALLNMNRTWSSEGHFTHFGYAISKWCEVLPFHCCRSSHCNWLCKKFKTCAMLFSTRNTKRCNTLFIVEWDEFCCAVVQISWVFEAQGFKLTACRSLVSICLIILERSFHILLDGCYSLLVALAFSNNAGRNLCFVRLLMQFG